MTNIFQKLSIGCERDCRIAYMGSTTTLMGFMPTYDKNGNTVGQDPNRVTSTYQCAVCGGGWTVEHQGDCDLIKKWPEKEASEP